MKIVHIFYTLLLFFVSCKPHEKDSTLIKPVTDSTGQKPENTNFFPVTSYIKGQIYEIKNGGKNPLKFVTIQGHTDSAWLKMEDLNYEFSDFLSPAIDTANLKDYYTEKKFLDQTLDAFTLTYDPIKTLPDTFLLKHWDVYIDPNTSQVNRIYLLKELPGKKKQQLSWISGKRCTIVTIADDKNGNSSVEKQVAIKWDY